MRRMRHDAARFASLLVVCFKVQQHMAGSPPGEVAKLLKDSLIIGSCLPVMDQAHIIIQQPLSGRRARKCDSPVFKSSRFPDRKSLILVV